MPLTDGLVAYWKLDEASGNRADSHGSNTLIDQNTVGSATGKINNAAQFVASSFEYLNISDNAALSTGDIDFTWTAWVQLASKGANRTILEKMDGSNAEYGLEYRTALDRFCFRVWGSSGFGNETTLPADTLGSPSTATWYFIVAWHSAELNTVNIQVGAGGTLGSVDSVGHTAGVFDSTAAFQLGAIPAFSQYWDGLIDEVGLWKRALTSQDRSDLYNNGDGLAYENFGGAALSWLPVTRTIQGPRWKATSSGLIVPNKPA